MKHGFTPSQIDSELCSFMVMGRNKCLRNEIEHTDRATCDECGNSGNCDFYLEKTELLLCETCLNIEREAAIARGNNGSHIQNSQLPEHAKLEYREVVNIEKRVNDSIRIREDIHNAKTLAIVSIKESIDNDTTIAEGDKHITLARTIEQRYNNLTDAIKGKTNEINDHLQEQHALQTYWQDLRKKLKDEERELIKLRDINYNPAPAPVKKTPKAPSIKKYDIKTVKGVYAQFKLATPDTKITEAMLMMTCLARNVDPKEALQIMKESGF